MAQNWWKQNMKWLKCGVLLVALALLFIPHQAAAQCGDDPGSSSCIDCHETAQQHPVYGSGVWHDIHALKDTCWNCHGGNTETADKVLAHEGMLENPLEDVYTDCRSCHPADYLVRAEGFASILGVSLGSCPTPTPVLIASTSNQPLVLPRTAVQPAPSEPRWLILLFGGVILGGLAATLVVLTKLGAPAKKED